MRRHLPLAALTSLVMAATAMPARSTPAWLAIAPQPQTQTLFTVTCTDSNNIWAGGENGTILHSTDGGRTWNAQASGTTLRVHKLRFVDAQHGWAACGAPNGYGGALLHTTNGGGTWTPQLDGTYYGFISALAATSRFDCWAADGYCDLERSADELTWTGRSVCATAPWPGGWIYGISFPDSTHGWVVGGGDIGSAGILHTSDGGGDWSLQPAPYAGELDGVVAVDSRHAWIWGAGWWGNMSGGFILHTIDGGTTWGLQEPAQSYNLHELFFADSSSGWGAGTYGTIVRTTDCGDTWTQQATGTSATLYGMQFSDPHHGWAVGEGGVMLRYFPDGYTLGVGDTPPALSATIGQNVPNPFGPQTTLSFALATAGRVQLSLYDVQGRLIRKLIDGGLAAGRHEAVWDGRDETGIQMSPGTYIARLLGAGRESSVRISLVR